MNSRRSKSRLATYGTLAALALTLGAVGPVHAVTTTQVVGDTAFKITAVAKTNTTSVKKKERFHARATVRYKATLLGLPLPLTAAYVNSIPLHFETPRLDEFDAELSSKKYKVMRDAWLKTDQWIVRGDKGFWGELRVTVKGSAIARGKGSAFFHGGTGTGHSVDANAAIRVTVK